jgi:antitoxin component YwqK of YwqJK toxin-antitoxin module
MLINNEYGTFVILEDRIFHIENNHIFDVGPISEEDKKELELVDWYVVFRKNGQLHRDNDLPAVIYANGEKEWYQNGQLHRDNDLPTVVLPSGTKLWYQNGKFIRSEYANQQ